MWNQEIDGNTTECVVLSSSDIKGNFDKQFYDPDANYAMTLLLEGQQPNTNGLDPYQGMMSGVCFGFLPTSLETFTAQTMGELYIANAANYSPIQRAAMMQHTANGINILFTYADIIAQLDAGNPVALPIHWYENFTSIGTDGVLPNPSGQYSNHCVAVYGYDEKGLLIKPWLGAGYGDSGYGHMSQTIFTQVFTGEAYCFAPNAMRWLSLLGEINYLKYLVKLLYA